MQKPGNVSAKTTSDPPRALDIIIPFSRNAHVAATLFKSLHRICDELSELACTVVALNGSSEDAELQQALDEAARQFLGTIPCRFIRNDPALGLVRAVNQAAQQAVALRHDVLLLSPDSIVFPDALRQMRAVAAADSRIGFVSPRSNRGTLCAFPPGEEFGSLGPDEAHAVFRQLSVYLPELQFTPTASAFCLLIAMEMLDEFGYFDDAYGLDRCDETDLILRANRCGYRAALANHAYVYRTGQSLLGSGALGADSGAGAEAAILPGRYPEAARIPGDYLHGAQRQAERLLTGLLPDREGRLDLVFDLSTVDPVHNGTYNTCKKILVRAAKLWAAFNIYVMASAEAVRFHGLDEIENVFFVSPLTQRSFALAFRFGQPFAFEHVFRMSRVAALNVYVMQDPIAYDCLYLSSVDLDTMWSAVFAHADGVLYISDFVRDAFRRRFRVRSGLQEKVVYHSLDSRDYAEEPGGSAGGNGYLLVMGNSFAHKRMAVTVDALSRAFPLEKIVALGLPEDHRHNVVAYPSGELSDKQMEQLMRGARLVVFPSTYEGFGLPVLESLAYKKPVLARQIATNRAIREKLGDDENLILYSSTRNLIERLKHGFPEWKDGVGTPGPGWDASVREIGEFLGDVSRSISFDGILVPRLRHMKLLEENAKAQAKVDEAARGMAGAAEAERRSRDAIARCEELRAAVADREVQIAELRNSWSWRITAPLRQLVGVFLRLTGKA